MKDNSWQSCMNKNNPTINKTNKKKVKANSKANKLSVKQMNRRTQ